MPSRDDSAGAALAAATTELYAVAPDEFIAARTALVQEAKERGDAALAREVGRLRRPTVAAWALNRTVRERPDQVERLRDVGARLRAAQAQLDAARLRGLRADREDLVAGLVAAASETAGAADRPLAPAALEEVRGTVIAALAAEEATDAVASGHLTRALSYSGFGEVDLSEAVARTSSGAVLTVVGQSQSQSQGQGQGRGGGRNPAEGSGPAAGNERGSKAASPPTAGKTRAQDGQEAQEPQEAQEARERRLSEAAAAHAEASAAAEDAALALDQARDRADEARWRVEELEAELQRARKEQHAAEQAATAAARARRTADAAAAIARRALDRVRAETSGRPG